MHLEKEITKNNITRDRKRTALHSTLLYSNTYYIKYVFSKLRFRAIYKKKNSASSVQFSNMALYCKLFDFKHEWKKKKKTKSPDVVKRKKYMY